MRIAHVGDAQFEFDFRGAGRPILLLHGAIVADGPTPLMREPALHGSFLVIHYRRRGYGSSTRLEMPWSIGQQAADAMALLRHLGLRRAHLLGYSYGAIIALQMALDFPEKVGALALLEPPLLNLVAGGPAFRRQMQPLADLYDRGHKAMAVEAYLETVFGPDYRDIMERALGPAAMTHAVADAETFLAYERPALDLWHFSQALALRLTNPMLAIVGGATAPPLAESHELLMHWYPKAEEFEIPEATHALPLMRPQEIAVALASFYARHPIEVSDGPMG